MRKLIALAMCLLLGMGTAYAEKQTVEVTGEYLLGDAETEVQGQERALFIAAEKAKLKAGVYVENYAKVKNFQLIREEAELVAGKIIEVRGKQFGKQVTGNGDCRVQVTATFVIDTDHIEAALRKRNEAELAAYLSTRKDYQRLIQENDKLLQELAQTTSPERQAAIKAVLKKNAAQFDVGRLNDEGCKYYQDGDFARALQRQAGSGR